MVRYPKYVHLGKNVKIEENVRLGVGREELGDLVIGDNSTIRSVTVIYRGAVIGNNFNSGHNALIREKNKIGNYVVVGSYSELAPGNKIGDYSNIQGHCFLEEAVLGQYVFLAPGVRILDDMFPIDPDTSKYRGAVIGNDVCIGGGAVLLPHIFIEDMILVGAGSVVTKGIYSGQVWVGNPAKFIKNVSQLKYPGTNIPYLPCTRKRWDLINGGKK